MRIRDYAAEDWEIAELARLGETQTGQLILKVLEKRNREIMDSLRKNGQVGCVDIKKDIRYKIGQADESDWIQELQAAAKEEVQRAK